MRPAKLSSKVFLELPPVLAHYVQAERNLWVEGNPKRGRFSLLGRSGNFVDIETMAVERRHLLNILGHDRARNIRYRVGFEQGRRDASRHYKSFGENSRLALQAALVFGQVQGRFVAEPLKFEFDLEQKTLFRELILKSSVEAVVHRMTLADAKECACWSTAGYLSGHVSEIVGRRVVTVETECMSKGDPHCRFISKFDHEWAEEGEWAREAMQMKTVEQELEERDAQTAEFQEEAQRVQVSFDDLNRRVRPDVTMDAIVADSEAMATVNQRTRQLMSSAASVMIVGESGTGKETLARSLHEGGARKEDPFITVDCVGLSGDLFTQELVGYEEGSLPGAPRNHVGAIVRANGGTLYLNELTEMTRESQGHLVTAINQRHVMPLGATAPISVDVRIIAATQYDPLEAIEEGLLRQDLYYALAIGRINLPPLRERETDIIRLAEMFLQEFAARHNRPSIFMGGDFKAVLLDCAWPGNLRQLRNVIEHAVIMAEDAELTPGDLPEEVLATRWGGRPKALTEEVIRAALSRCHNNRSQAADLLGVGRTTLWRAMKRLNVA